MGLAITNGHVIDPANNIDGTHTLYINDGFIAGVGDPPEDFEAEREIDASGLIVCPGLIDIRARLRSVDCPVSPFTPGPVRAALA